MTVREKKRRPVEAPGRITITVGIHADAGAQPHQVANDIAPVVANDIDRALTVAEVGTFHEFGVGPFRMRGGGLHPGIPQRSFIRGWFDEQQSFIVATLQSQLALVIAGKVTAEKAGARIALAFEGSMKQRISRGIPPPNAPRTIAEKGSSKPLIHRGQLRNAIRARADIESVSASGGGSEAGAAAE